MANKKYPMKGQAEKLAKQGRYGDSMLVHMNPAEVDFLKSNSPTGGLTNNPQTGQPEAFPFASLIPAALATVGAFGSKSKQQQTDESTPVVQPSASQQYAAPGVELTSRQLLDAYFNPEYGMIGQQIPIPVQQVAGLSPQEVQARNLAQGLGGFGGQLSEAQDMYRRAAQGFDPRSAGAFADPRARALYEQSIGAYDPRMGQQFIDQQARAMQMGAAGGMGREAAMAQQEMMAAGRGANRESRIGQRAMERAGQGIGGQVTGAQAGAMDAAQRARMQTQMAGRDLRSAGQMGQAAAMQGIAGLAGTGSQFNPSSVSSFMDPFNRDVIEAQQAEIARLGEQQKIAARDQAVRSGAFGGSRGAIAQAEIGRNVLQQQAKTGAELRSQGFQQAQKAAQQAFEQAQGRRQQAAQLTGSLGQAGAQTGISAAQQAANLGLSAEQLAQRGALEGGQLGLSGLTSQADIAQRAAQMGISTQELAGRLAQQGGALGLQAQQGIAGIGSGLGRDFQSAQQLGSGIFGDQMSRMQGAAGGMDRMTRGAFGDAMSAYQAGQQGMRAGAQGIAGLGQQGFDMLTSQIGTTAGLGATGRGIQQRGLDAQYKAGTQMADEPFMRLQRGFNVLGQGAQFMPGYSTGFGSGQQGVGTYQQPGTAARAMNALSFGANFMPSDIRLKENVIKVDEVEPGVGWYTWNWNDTAKAMGVDGPTEGVIAQELVEVDPSAVLMGEDGYYRVDYSKFNRKEAEAQ